MTEQKLNAGEIGTRAGRIFNYKIPDHWIIRSQEDQNDHGIDAEIELKDNNGKALGKEKVFKVQIKGEFTPTYINKGQTLSFNLSIEKLKYYFEFKMPVILVVVDVSKEKIFWISVTDNENLRNSAYSSPSESIQIHIPVENEIISHDDNSTAKVITDVSLCWEFLYINGLRSTVSNLHEFDIETIDKSITSIGSAFFAAHHKKLDKHLENGNFLELYNLASELANSGELVPYREKFTAALYYERAFNIQPYKEIRVEQYYEKTKIVKNLMFIARESKNQTLRMIAIGKSRGLQLEIIMDELFALFNTTNNFDDKSFEHLFFNQGISEKYRECCLILQKQIYLFNRLISKGQYRAVADLFCSNFFKIVSFKVVHKEKGSKESIEFLDKWLESTALIIFSFTLSSKDYIRAKDLFFMSCNSKDIIEIEILKLKETVSEYSSELLKEFIDIENYCNERNSKATSINDLSIEEQKKYFIKTAKDLRMDPDDPECEIGRIVANGILNYDPSDIVKNCTHMFVDYRPGGMPYQMLGMHSMGGLHLLVCLKHKYMYGTGASIHSAYENEFKTEPLFGFKNKYCENCTDCEDREKNWKWSLKWQREDRIKHENILNLFKI